MYKLLIFLFLKSILLMRLCWPRSDACRLLYSMLLCWQGFFKGSLSNCLRFGPTCINVFYINQSNCFLVNSFSDVFACVQNTAGQLRNRKSGSSGRAKETEKGESITFADVAGVDEAKEELEEIVVSKTLLIY